MKDRPTSTRSTSSSQGQLPFDRGVREATAIYARRILDLLLAAAAGLLFTALYVAVYKLGLRALYFLGIALLLVGFSFLLASMELLLGNLGLTRLFQSMRYLIEQIITIAALLLISPIFFLIALAVSLESQGSVFVRRIMVGRYGRPFSRLTFRTVALLEREGEDNGGSEIFNARPTQIGRILQRTRLDRLPMLLNVAKGDMSLFGESPETPYALLGSGPLNLRKLMFRPGVLQPHRTWKWDTDLPSEVIDYWHQVNVRGTRGRHNLRVLLLGIKGRHADGLDDVAVLPFLVTSEEEPSLREQLSRLTSSNVDVLGGDITRIAELAALIEAAWTAWCDLPSRVEDPPLREEDELWRTHGLLASPDI